MNDILTRGIILASGVISAYCLFKAGYYFGRAGEARKQLEVWKFFEKEVGKMLNGIEDKD